MEPPKVLVQHTKYLHDLLKVFPDAVCYLVTATSAERVGLKTSLLHRLQVQPVPDATPVIGIIHSAKWP